MGRVLGVRALFATLLLGGCNLIAPFDPADQRDPEEVAQDEDDAGVDGDVVETCEPQCGEEQICGPDGCGGVCGEGCAEGQVCVACSPIVPCDEPYACAEPAPGQWLFLTAGDFEMGSPASEAGRGDDEPRHEISLSHDFVILSSEVTSDVYGGVIGRDPSYFPIRDPAPCARDCPVENVTWSEAARFCNALSLTNGLATCYECESRNCEPSPACGSPYECPGYRLPTEAEWEYTARAGDTRATYRGDLSPDELDCVDDHSVLDEIAWHCGNSEEATHDVGGLEPNDWGLYDVLGNVAEWCHDWYSPEPGGTSLDPAGPDSGSQRVVRGGSWEDEARDLRAAARAHLPPSRREFVGFRPVRTVSFPPATVE